MTTVALQRQATKRLRISGEEVMKLAENLYRQGIISYPRTETDSFPDGFDFTSLISSQADSGMPWADYARALLQDNKYVTPKKGKNNDHAHSPIHPTKPAPNLQGRERDIYELVTRHFLACCSADAKGAETTVELELNGERFKCTGLTILETNYLDVYKYDRWTDKNIPIFREGEQFTPDAVEMKEGTTTPPSLLTEADLIKLMDQNGIGTDATIAQHIQTIQERSYAEKSGIYFSPTNLGHALLEAYIHIGHDLGKPAGRAATEADMKLIERGQKTKEEVVAQTLATYRAILENAMARAEEMEAVLRKHFAPAGMDEAPGEQFTLCGRCDQRMTFQQKARSLVCGTCNESHSLPRNGTVTPYDHRCPLCNFQIVLMTNTEKNTSYKLCPWCHSHPPAAQGQPGDAPLTTMPCFLCTADCPLAKTGGGPGLTTCPMPGCTSQLRLTGGYFIGCKNYPTCKATLNLPDRQTFAMTDQKCPTCSGTYLMSCTNAAGCTVR